MSAHSLGGEASNNYVAVGNNSHFLCIYAADFPESGYPGCILSFKVTGNINKSLLFSLKFS